MINLSVIILFDVNDLKYLSILLKNIYEQNRDDIEIIVVNKDLKNTISLINGKYFVCISANDNVNKNYINKILKSIEKNPTSKCHIYGYSDNNMKYKMWGMDPICWVSDSGQICEDHPMKFMVYCSELKDKYFNNDIENICKEIIKYTEIDDIIYYRNKITYMISFQNELMNKVKKNIK